MEEVKGCRALGWEVKGQENLEEGEKGGRSLGKRWKRKQSIGRKRLLITINLLTPMMISSSNIIISPFTRHGSGVQQTQGCSSSWTFPRGLHRDDHRDGDSCHPHRHRHRVVPRHQTTTTKEVRGEPGHLRKTESRYVRCLAIVWNKWWLYDNWNRQQCIVTSPTDTNRLDYNPVFMRILCIHCFSRST